MTTDQFAKTLDTLIELALDDGIISQDELRIIRQVELDSKSYHEMLDEALDDGIISKDEGTRLGEFKKSMIQRVEEIATEDGHLTDEEHKLIRKLVDIISTKYRKY